MGSEQSQALFDKFRQAAQSGYLSQYDGDIARFADKTQNMKVILESLIENDPQNPDHYLKYATTLMKGGQKELALKHIKLYWNLCDKSFPELIDVIAALQEDLSLNSINLALKYCKLGSKMIKDGECNNLDDMFKIRYYLHYAHVRWYDGFQRKKMKKLLKKALFILDNYKNFNMEGRIYQMRLQLATDYLNIGLYDISLKQMRPILKYKNKQYFQWQDEGRGDERILVNKNKICKIYGELMMVHGKYKKSRQYLLEITDEKDYCLAISDYAINGLLMKCSLELNQFNDAMMYYMLSVKNQKNVKSLNNKMIDYQHCLGLYLYKLTMDGDMDEARKIYRYLKEMKHNETLHCCMSICYMAYYIDYNGKKYKALLTYLNAIYGNKTIRKYPEIYYHFSLCLLKFESIILAQKYLKRIYKYNKTQKVRSLNDKIKRKYKTLKCMQCGKSVKDGKLKTCSGCGVAFYCSKSCQKKAWNREGDGHREKCGGLFRIFAVRKKQWKAMRNTKTQTIVSIPQHNSVYYQ